jgi:hypothetical protein
MLSTSSIVRYYHLCHLRVPMRGIWRVRRARRTMKYGDTVGCHQMELATTVSDTTLARFQVQAPRSLCHAHSCKPVCHAWLLLRRCVTCGSWLGLCTCIPRAPRHERGSSQRRIQNRFSEGNKWNEWWSLLLLGFIRVGCSRAHEDRRSQTISICCC